MHPRKNPKGIIILICIFFISLLLIKSSHYNYLIIVLFWLLLYILYNKNIIPNNTFTSKFLNEQSISIKILMPLSLYFYNNILILCFIKIIIILGVAHFFNNRISLKLIFTTSFLIIVFTCVFSVNNVFYLLISLLGLEYYSKDVVFYMNRPTSNNTTNTQSGSGFTPINPRPPTSDNVTNIQTEGGFTPINPTTPSNNSIVNTQSGGGFTSVNPTTPSNINEITNTQARDSSMPIDPRLVRDDINSGLPSYMNEIIAPISPEQQDVDKTNQALQIVGQLDKDEIIKIAESARKVMHTHDKRVNCNPKFTYSQLAVVKSIMADSDLLHKSKKRYYGLTSKNLFKIDDGSYNLYGFYFSLNKTSGFYKSFDSRLTEYKNDKLELYKFKFN